MLDDVMVAEWLRDKLDSLSEEYRIGFGYGDIYESQYLCYLECLAMVRGIDPETFWEDWKAVCRATGKLTTQEMLLPMNRILGDDRPALIKALEGFKRRWVDGPTPRRAVPKTEVLPQASPAPAPEAVEEPEVSAPAPPTGEPPKLGTGRPEKLGKKGKGKRVNHDEDGSILDLLG